jgi:hypothetical protein
MNSQNTRVRISVQEQADWSVRLFASPWSVHIQARLLG